MYKYRILLVASITFSLLLSACGGGGDAGGEAAQSKRAGINEVLVHELADPDMLNPANSNSANSTYIEYNIFMYLLDIDKESLEIVPSLAKERPALTEINEGEYAGGLRMDYEIRPEAVWDNGSPVTGHDVAFTYKAIKNPMTDAQDLRPYLEFIDDVVVDEANPKKFTIYSKQRYFMSEFVSGNVFILPEHVYDPEQLMRKYTIRRLNDAAETSKLRGEPAIINFAQSFNAEKHQREKGFVEGAGPYSFEEWVTGQRVVLKRKANWWGDKLTDKVWGFEARPEKLTYEIINDWTTAVTALKDDGLDVARGIRPKDFIDLQNDPNFMAKNHAFQPTEMSYAYIGLNMKNPKLTDVKVRKALAYLVDREQIIDILLYGLGEPTIGPIHPTKPYFNKNIQAYTFDMDKARQLLDEAGWKDTDSDGVRDKIVDGKKLKLSFTFKYNAGNDTREKIGLFFKENARKVGVEVEVLTREWTVYLDEVRNHDFEICCLGWVQDPIIDDMKQIWHTESYNGGGNYTGFGNAETDAIVEGIRYELDEQKRFDMYRKMQEIIHEQVPYIFLYTPYNRLTISKRFDNAAAYLARPGYQDRILNVVQQPQM